MFLQGKYSYNIVVSLCSFQNVDPDFSGLCRMGHLDVEFLVEMTRILEVVKKVTGHVPWK